MAESQKIFLFTELRNFNKIYLQRAEKWCAVLTFDMSHIDMGHVIKTFKWQRILIWSDTWQIILTYDGIGHFGMAYDKWWTHVDMWHVMTYPIDMWYSPWDWTNSSLKTIYPWSLAHWRLILLIISPGQWSLKLDTNSDTFSQNVFSSLSLTC